MTIRSGRNGAYFWLASGDHTLAVLLESCPEVVVSRRVAIIAFDGDALRLTPEEVAQGWEQRGDIAVSPIVNEPSILVHEGWDEWYVFERDIPEFSDVEVFVNNGGFSPVRLAEMQAGMKWDSTWEPPRPDPLEDALLERFWTTIARLDPLVYIAEGDLLTVVMKSEQERDRVLERLRL